MAALRTDRVAVVETSLVHNMHRRATSLLPQAAAQPAAGPDVISELRDFVVAVLRHHHHSEDERLWPIVVAAVPGLGDELAGLSREHADLDAALEVLAAVPVRGDSRSDVIDPASAVRDLVHRHLDREERVLLPALQEHVSTEAWADFSQYAVATAPSECVHLLLAFFDRVGTPAEVELVVGNLPEPARHHAADLRAQSHPVLDVLDPLD